jgi:type VI secretion system protein ImpJ
MILHHEVYWYEGMFLAPQHLQAAGRYMRGQLALAEEWQNPYSWGFRSVEFDPAALDDFTLVLNGCEARFRDGTRLVVPCATRVEPLSLRDHLLKKGEATVVLAVSRLDERRANVNAPGPMAKAHTGEPPRFEVESVEMCDENTGDNPQIIDLLRTRARLLLADSNLDGYEWLPLARVVWSSAPVELSVRESTLRLKHLDAAARSDVTIKELDVTVGRSEVGQVPPQLDPAFIPPLLAVDGWPALATDLKALWYEVDARVGRLAEDVIGSGASYDGQMPGDTERLLQLGALNGVAAYLRSLAAAPRQPPLWVYQELARAAGQLAVFTETRRAPDLVGYRHDELGASFGEVLRAVRLGLAGMRSPASFERRDFTRAGDRLQVSVEPAWLAANRRVYLGVRSDLPEGECLQALRAMELRVGCRQAHRPPAPVPADRVPRAFRQDDGMLFFSVERDPAYWGDVAETRTLAVRLNLTRAALGERGVTVESARSPRPVSFDFALFVV